MNFLAPDPKCMLDIYEVEDEETWVRCQIAQSKKNVLIAAAVVVIAVIFLFIFSSSYTWKVALSGLFVVGGLAAYSEFMAKPQAEAEFRALNMELKKRMDTGMTRAQAFESISAERLKREELASNQKNALTIAAAIAKGMRSK